jgi:hypothetical protein
LFEGTIEFDDGSRFHLLGSLVPGGYAWRFEFNQGDAFDGDELWFDTTREHCVCAVPENNPILEPRLWFQSNRATMAAY